MKYRIPIFPTLSPTILFQRTVPRVFPFNAPRRQRYYLARNAIWHGVEALGLRPDDEVLVPAYHHGVEIAALLARGLKLVPYGIDSALNADLDDIRSRITPRTRMLYVIHYLGFPQPIHALRQLADEHGLLLFEDCALSCFSEAPEGPLGSFGDASIFCAYKTLPVPHGGLLVLNKDDVPLPPAPSAPNSVSTVTYVIKRMLDHCEMRWGLPGRLAIPAVRWVARSGKRAAALQVAPIDGNDFHMEHVSMGVSGFTSYLIDRLDARDVVRQRRENYQALAAKVHDGVRLLFPDLPDGVCPLFLPVLVRDRHAAHEALLAEGIHTVEFWSLGHPDLPSDLAQVRFLRQHVLEIPIHQGVGTPEIDRLANALLRHAQWKAPRHVPMPRTLEQAG